MYSFELGWLNAKRNLVRSLFAILSMAIAAGFLTYSISLSRGYPLMYKADARAIVGGEVIVHARQFGGQIPSGDSLWQHNFIDASPLSDLQRFHPELLTFGYLSMGEDHSNFRAEDMQHIAGAAQDTNAQAIYPRYQLPAKQISGQSWTSAPLHGRDAQMDALLTRHPEELLTQGRWFAPQDDGQYVAVLSRIRPAEMGPTPGVEETITLAIPRLMYINGVLTTLEGNPLVKEFTIIGHIEAITRYYTSEGGNTMPVQWELEEVQIPLATWQDLWLEAGGAEYQPEQLSIIYDDMSYLEDIVFDLRQALPTYGVYGLPEYFASAESRGLIEYLPMQLQNAIVEEHTQTALPLDMRVPFTAMIFINSAMIVAANLLIMIAERTKEIGILKSVGSTRAQIMAMSLGESLSISLTGALLGFAFFRIPAALAQLTNRIHPVTILSSIASDAAIVGGVTLAFALVFGLLPAVRMSGLPVMEVMRSE